MSPGLYADITQNGASVFAVDLVAELLTYLKKGQPLGFDLNDFTRFGVTPHVGLLIFNDKTAKAPDFYSTTRSESICHRIKDDINDLF
jgi:hypothetical protein